MPKALTDPHTVEVDEIEKRAKSAKIKSEHTKEKRGRSMRERVSHTLNQHVRIVH